MDITTLSTGTVEKRAPLSFMKTTSVEAFDKAQRRAERAATAAQLDAYEQADGR